MVRPIPDCHIVVGITITTNIIGVQNMLDFAVAHHATRLAFTSSNEIYGENRGDEELFDEEY